MMGAFFDARLDTYDAHMLNNIASAKEFYPFTASLLPQKADTSILDLGCGTGLELEEYFKRCPTASVTGIDLAPRMLETMKDKFKDKQVTAILGSYFSVPFGISVYDAAVSVESLHHFTKSEKIPLYRKLYNALRPGGYLILTDYFALSDEEEVAHRTELVRLKAEQGISDGEFYHYDTPLTVAHETEALLAGGFDEITVEGSWGATFTLKAIRRESSSPLFLPQSKTKF
jgi:tRNA (cmo5U34)-methyltransferase